MAAFVGHKERDIVKNRIEAMDLISDVLYYGDSKGFVYMAKITLTDKKFSTKEFATTRISKDAIISIKAIKSTKTVLVLSAGRVFLLDSTNLEAKKTLIKTEATQLTVSINGNIAIALDNRLIVQMSKENRVKEFSFTAKILNMIWNGELLGIASTKSYLYIDPVKNSEQEFSHPNNAPHPCILVFGDYWLVVNSDSIVLHEKLGAPLPGSSILMQEFNQPVLEMIVKSFYLLVLMEKNMDVYNLLDFNRIQRMDFDKECVYKTCAMDNENLLLAMDIVMGYKKDLTSVLIYLYEIPAEVQIKQLLAESKIPEAHNVFLQSCQSISQDFEEKREQFNIDAAWALYVNLEFTRGEEYFLQTNYDPRELVTLVSTIMETKYQRNDFITLEMLVQRKSKEMVKETIIEGINSIIVLLEEKRKYLSGEYSFIVDRSKLFTFIRPTVPLNPSFKGDPCEYKEIMKFIDTSLLKLYVKNKQIMSLKSFLENTKDIQCNYKEMEIYLKEHFKNDLITHSAEICQAFLYEKGGDYKAALNIWKELIQKENKEVKDIVSKSMIDILSNKIRDKNIFQEYAKSLLVSNPNEGIQLFTGSEKLIMSEDEVCDFLESIESRQPLLKVQYLEFLVKKPISEERFQTRLGLHYAAKVKESLTDDSGAVYEEARKKLKEYLMLYKIYDTQAILGATKGMGLLEEEILLYSMQKMHNEALASLIDLGKRYIDFSAAEKYCLEQPEALLALLFKKVLHHYDELKVKHKELENKTNTKGTDIVSLKKYIDAYGDYCKGFLKKYAKNEKMDAEAVISLLPDEWIVNDEGEDSILDYLTLTLKDRLGKADRYKIARNAAELQKINLEYENLRMQRAYVIVKSHNKCKACDKSLDARHFYIFPNGIVTHTHCAKDVNTCPATNVNFTKRLYD